MVKRALQILLPTLKVYDVGTFEEAAYIQRIYLVEEVHTTSLQQIMLQETRTVP